MNKQFYSVYDLRVEIRKDVWESMRRKLIEKIPMHGELPSLFARLSVGSRTEVTQVIKRCLSPTWEGPFQFSSVDDGAKMEIELIHKASFRFFNNPRVGYLSVSVNELSPEGKSYALHLPSSTTVAGSIQLRLAPIATSSALIAANDSVATIKNQDHETDIYTPLKNFVEIAKPMVKAIDGISQIHPYLSAGWKIMSSLYSVIDKQSKADEKLVKLVEEMSMVFKFVIEIEKIKNKNDTLKEVELKLACQITECCLFIKEYMGHGFLRRAISQQDHERIDELMALFEGIRRHFDTGVNVQSVEGVSRIEMAISRIKEDTDILGAHASLRPESMGSNPHSTCLPGTRLKYIQKIYDLLLLDTNKQRIVWLNGPAGVGKSTIALTIAERFARLSRLGAYIFFTQNQSQPGQLIQTIVDKLAFFDASIAEHVKNIQSSCMDLTLEYQFEHLLLEPLKKAADRFEGPVIIILDALDECGDATSRVDLLKLLSSGEFSKLPQNIRILITSRPEKDIVEAVGFQKNCIHTIDISPLDKSGREDVTLYLRYELNRIIDSDKEKDPADISCLGHNIDKVISSANGLFIWASTMVRLVKQDPRPTYKLGEIARHIQPERNHKFNLNKMYETILSSSNIFDNYKETMCKMLSFILLYRKPISGEGLKNLLGLRVDEIGLLSGLQSVLFYSRAEPIHFYHVSFSDYLTNKKRSGRYYVDVEAYRDTISDCCFSVMFRKGGLRVNICELPSPLVMYDNVPRLRDYISEELECACTLWSCMRGRRSGDKRLSRKLEIFVREYLLQWLEAMSLTKNFRVVDQMLLKAIQWAEEPSKEYVQALVEARRLAKKYYIPMSQSVPHVYLSMMVFEKGSVMTKWYKHLVSPIAKVEEHGSKPMDRMIHEFKGHKGRVRHISYSPDGQFIVSNYGKTIKIWDAHSELPPITLPYFSEGYFVRTFAFSSGGDLLAVVFNDKKYNYYSVISIFRVGTWELVINPFPTGDLFINALSFYESGKSIITCSCNGEIKLWDVSNGSVSRLCRLSDIIGRNVSRNRTSLSSTVTLYHRGYPDQINFGNIKHGKTRLGTSFVEQDSSRDNCEGFIQNASFSSNGHRIAVRLQTGVTHICNLNDYPETSVYTINISLLDDINDVFQLSGNGSVLVGKYYDKFKIWDANSGICLRSEEASAVSRKTISLSQDGELMATSEFNSVLIRVVKNNEIVAGPFRILDADMVVNAVVLSPDNSCITIDCGDGKIRIWNIEQSKGIPDYGVPLQVRFSEDGRVVSFWEDGNIRTWDKNYKTCMDFVVDEFSQITPDGKLVISPNEIRTTQTGEITQQIDIKTPSNNYLWPSYDGRIIASLSKGLLSVWEQAHDGKFKFEKRIYIYNTCSPVDRSMVAFAYDGSLIAINRHGVYSIYDIVNKWKRYQFKSKVYGQFWDGCVAFSPCNSYIACTSHTTVSVYDIKRNRLVRKLRSNGEIYVSLAYSKDGCKLASGSRRGKIIVWNTKTGHILFGPSVGHLDRITSLSFSVDGLLLVSSSTDQTIRIWNLIKPSEYKTRNNPNSPGLKIWAREFFKKVRKPDSWVLAEDGWVRDDKNHILIWVPLEYRPVLYRARNLAILGNRYSVKLSFI